MVDLALSDWLDSRDQGQRRKKEEEVASGEDRTEELYKFKNCFNPRCKS
jgi:hypothetical protein